MTEPLATEPAGKVTGSDPEFSDLVYPGSGTTGTHPDATVDELFRLQGSDDNRLVGLATPLLGMVIRVRRLADFREVERLYKQVVDEIGTIEQELKAQGYDRQALLAYRYVLCAFVDEAVLGTDWGAHSIWSQHSLLSRFHNETWGGEKVFAILARMQQEPARHRDMLEFIYLCLCLGFEGRYKVMANGREEYEKVVYNLYQSLSSLASEQPAPLAGSAWTMLFPAATGQTEAGHCGALRACSWEQ